MAGWVYILSNPVMPGLLKIGFTTRDSAQRASELSSESTGVALPYEVEYEVYTSHPYEVEQKTHKILSQYRVNKNREFFECRYEEAVEAIRKAMEYCDYDISDFSYTSETSYKVLKEELDRKILEKQKKLQEAEKRRKEYERMQWALGQQKIKEENEKRKKELEISKIEDRTKLVIEYEREIKRSDFFKQVEELEKHLSKREMYAYHFSLPLNDIELREWILNPDIPERVVERYFSKHYPDIYCSEIYPILKRTEDAPTPEDKKKLLELKKFVEDKEQKRADEEAKKSTLLSKINSYLSNFSTKELLNFYLISTESKNWITKNDISYEDAVRYLAQNEPEIQSYLRIPYNQYTYEQYIRGLNSTELELILKKMEYAIELKEEIKRIEEIEKQKEIERIKLLNEQKKLLLEEQRKQAIPRKKESYHNMIFDLEKQIDEVKKSCWILHIDDNKWGIYGVFLLISSGLLFVFEFFLDFSSTDKILNNIPIIGFLGSLIFPLLFLFMGLLFVVPIVYKNKKHTINQINNKIQEYKNEIEKLNQ